LAVRHAEDSPDPGRDPLLLDVCEVSHRLLAGLVSRKTMRDLQALVRSSQAAYPWREVVERALGEPVEEAALLQSGLKAQREWILRGGRLDAAGESRRSCLGSLVSIGLVFLAFLATVVVILVVARMHWPQADIYRLIDWLHETFPGRFKPR
jgi:hypothetical protein